MSSYCTYGDYMVVFTKESQSLDLIKNHKTIVSGLRFVKNGSALEIKIASRDLILDCNTLTFKYDDSENLIALKLNDDGVFFTLPEPMHISASTCADDSWKAMSSTGHGFFRSGLGHAITPLDDMLFDRDTDTAVMAKGADSRAFAYDKEACAYRIEADVSGTLNIAFEEKIYETKYRIPYAPMRSNDSFSGHAPVGWMTWYAVKFDACEERVLANAKWMAENLKKYGAETIWVDWEWYHRDMKGERDDGCDTFHPDKNKYPNGLKYLSDEIRKLGLIPSLWIGFTVDPAKNDFIKEHPKSVLCYHPMWCGSSFFDMSYPPYINEFLPKALKQVDEWGFDAVKYDTLATTMNMHEHFHYNMYDPTLTTREVFRNMITKTREVLGHDRYMLCCAGPRFSDILWGCDKFDAARIGGDVFRWKEFIKETIGQTALYYPFHNVVFYNDPDNVILREEFNTPEQAGSRCAFVSLLGMPITFGDDLTKLPEERVEMLKRIIPTPDIRPMDVGRTAPGNTVVTVLSIANDSGEYTVLGVLNATEEPTEAVLTLSDYGIDCASPLAYEFRTNEQYSVSDGKLTASLLPNETKIFAIRENKGVPQILATSRHITMGALELSGERWDEDLCTLSFTSELVEGDEYSVYVNVPDGYAAVSCDGMDMALDGDVLRVSVTADTSCKRAFAVRFERG